MVTKQALIKILITAVTAVIFGSAIAQVPQGINYQAIARAADGTVLQNTKVKVRFTVHQNAANGPAEYAEEFDVATNQFGLFTAVIGAGQVLRGKFDSVDWGGSSKFLQVEIDVNETGTYADMGTGQMMSVPYALFAGNVAGNHADGEKALSPSGPTGATGPTGPTGAQGIAGAAGAKGATGTAGAKGATGATGAAGIAGAAGAKGATGATGIAGSEGATGATGTAGAKGATGAKGVTGAPGATGIQGPTGNEGPTGAAGLPGNNGINGTNGTTGATGPQGLAGNDGAQGLPGQQGATGAPGLPGTNGANGTNGATGATGPQGPAGNDGANGTQGPQGVQGVTGAQGPQGVQGATGATGVQGPTGNEGPTGAAGLPGNNGINGTNGTTGATGPQGPAGNDGAQGLPGQQGATGANGTNGATGATGPQGPEGNVGANGTQGPQGVQGVTGAQGPQGVQGATGPQGPKGNDGANGTQGPQGVQGVTGTQGPQGVQGDTGPQGPAGNDGANGMQGPQGVQGVTGAQGPQGIQGATGPQGPAGNNGANGTQGPQGVQGVTGAQGSQGIQGATGPQGPAGNDGANGTQGPQGVQGITGAQGPQGVQGATGPQGPQGLQGVTGAQGPTGNDGADGATGVQGPTGLLGNGSTAGNTPYWDGTQWVLNSSNIYNAGGNIGIGTSIPATTLEINGQVQIDGGNPVAGAVLTSDVNGLATWQNAANNISANNGLTVGIPVANPGPGGLGGGLTPVGPGGPTGVSPSGNLPTTPAVELGGPLLQNTNIALNGNSLSFTQGTGDAFAGIGIGTASPTAALDIETFWPAFKLADGSQQAGYVLTSDAYGNATWQIPGNGANIYNADGTLTATRSVNLIDYDLNFSAYGGNYNFTTDNGNFNVTTFNGNINMGAYNSVNGSQGVGLGTSNSVVNSGVGIGYGNFSQGLYATALGFFANAGGDYSTTLGNWTKAYSYQETALGANNIPDATGNQNAWVPTDNLLVVGNGSSYLNPSNALTILKNGNTGIGTSTPSATLDISGTLHFNNNGQPIQSGYVLTSDASGNASWQPTIPGATGPSGITGATGLTGPTGYMGATGAQGVTGATGATGVGTQGPQGATGATGPSGNDGLPGGPSGATGPTGPTGPNGLGNGTAMGNTTYWDGTQWVLNSSSIYNAGDNIGIGTNNPDGSAQLDLTSASRGFLPPRMNTASMLGITTPAAGLIVYNTDLHCMEFYADGAWQPLACSCPKLGTLGAIQGPTSVCAGTQVTYSVLPIPGASTYNWSIDGNQSFTGQGTNTITLTVPVTGILTVYLTAQNACGTSSSQAPQLNITNASAIAPNADAPTNGNSSSFVANWDPGFNQGTISAYYLDVATDVNFNNILPGYNNLLVPGTAQSQLVTGLICGNSYYYRLRATTTDCPYAISVNSNVQGPVTSTTSGPAVFNNPSVNGTAAAIFTVPACVYKIHVVVIGGDGGMGSNNSFGGAGAAVNADIAVTPGQQFYMNVGGAGANSRDNTMAPGGVGASAGFEGGAGYGDNTTRPVNISSAPTPPDILGGGGAGGGGASTLAPVNGLVWIVAGGGGGSTSYNFGGPGAAGLPSGSSGVGLGTATGGSLNGAGLGEPDPGNQGCPEANIAGADGHGFSGGDGGRFSYSVAGSCIHSGGGGGGGGWFGGGGGCSAGGGGGGSLANTTNTGISNVSYTNGDGFFSEGPKDGSITVTW